jgi:hypothetical protein
MNGHRVILLTVSLIVSVSLMAVGLLSGVIAVAMGGFILACGTIGWLAANME